jgi:DNA-binding response OmpR family regulator
MALMLGGAGHDVTDVTNGFAALRWPEQEGYDLVITDVKMPESDGLGLYAEIRARWPRGSPRILFVSGFADTAAYPGALKAINAPLLSKPFSLDDLCKMVGRVLEVI